MKISKLCLICLLPFILGQAVVYAENTDGVFQSETHLREMLKYTQNQLNSAQGEIAKLQEDNYDLKNLIKEKENYGFSLKLEIDNLNKKIEDLKTSQEPNRAENPEFVKKISALQSLINDYKEKIKENDNYISACKNSIENYKSRLNQYSGQINDYENIIKTNEKQIDNYKNTVNSLNREIASLNNRLSMVKETSLNLQNREKDETQELQNNIVYWKTKAENLEKDLLEANEVIVSSSKESLNDEFVNFARNNPDMNPQYYFMLGKMLYQKGDYTKAIENYKIALQKNPDFAKAYCELGITYANAKDYENSLQSFEKYLGFIDNPREKAIISEFMTKIQTILNKA